MNFNEDDSEILRRNHSEKNLTPNFIIVLIIFSYNSFIY